MRSPERSIVPELLESGLFGPLSAALAAYCRNRGKSHTAAAQGDFCNPLLESTNFRLIRVWQTACTEGGMLRITLPTASHSGLFILEGRLTGLWVKELLRVARGINQACGSIFDLQEVFYVDSEGENALRLLSGRGAKFITDSAYGKDLCHRLKLRRVTPSEGEGNNGKSGEGSRKSRHCRNSFGGTLDALTAADANQHPSSCRG